TLVQKHRDLTQGPGKLPDDVLNGHHGAERTLTVDHLSDDEQRQNQIIDLDDGLAAAGLQVIEQLRLDLNFPDGMLRHLPLPPTLLFRVVQLDLLHAREKLDDQAMSLGGQMKGLVVEQALILHKERHKSDVKRGACRKLSE